MTIRTGSTRFPSTNFKTSTYCVAYLDILDGANKICEDKNCIFLNHLNMFFQDALDEKQHLFKEYKNEIFTKIFSDNILYAIKIKENDDKKNDKIMAIFNLISNLYSEIFNYGHLMRGAIVLTMDILIVGNRFDLVQGLKTSYKDFFDFCKKN